MEKRPPLHLGVVAIEKGAFGSPSTMVANFYLLTKDRIIFILLHEIETLKSKLLLSLSIN